MKIGIVGLGLIGGSLGLDLMRHNIDVVGISRNKNTCRIAIEKNVVNDASVELSILKNTDIVFICTPIEAIASTVKSIIPYLNSETIITDVGSVKTPIVKNCSELWHNFIGGHPMAGNEKQGIEFAQYDLFQKAAYVLTPTEFTPINIIKKVEKIVQLLGSRIYICSPEIHDKSVAFISHLPVIISTALINTCMNEKEYLKLIQDFASSGFRDTSRVGGGNVELGLMMAKYNRQELLFCLQKYRQNLDEIISQIDQENWENLEQIFRKSQQARPHFLH